MKKIFIALCIAALAMTALAVYSGNNVAVAETTEATPTGGIVTIADAHGTVEVPLHPEVVVSLDNRTFETLADWGIALAAAPKAVMPADSPYVADASVQDIGNHREPNLEVIAAVDPQLVIVGQRFASYYEDIKALGPNAAVINLNIDVSEASEHPGEALVAVIGNLPFLGLIVPNIVSIVRGDDVKSNLPWVALFGMGAITFCDILSRTLIMPFEVPVSLILGVAGTAVFLLLLRQRRKG